jgi:hypothetical protein
VCGSGYPNCSTVLAPLILDRNQPRWMGLAGHVGCRHGLLQWSMTSVACSCGPDRVIVAGPISFNEIGPTLFLYL